MSNCPGQAHVYGPVENLGCSLKRSRRADSTQMPVRAQARDEMQEANHGKLHRKSKISRSEDHTKPGRAMYEGRHTCSVERVEHQ
jgi:hypothetical protein